MLGPAKDSMSIIGVALMNIVLVLRVNLRFAGDSCELIIGSALSSKKMELFALESCDLLTVSMSINVLCCSVLVFLLSVFSALVSSPSSSVSLYASKSYAVSLADGC